MGERSIRLDPLTGEAAILSPDRWSRPWWLDGPRRPASPTATCPFCPGNEGLTTPTIDAVTVDGAWQVRAFANLHPALVLEARSDAVGGLYPAMDGLGCHEVLVESPRHDAPPIRQTPEERRQAWTLAQRRLRDLAQDRRLRVLVWYRNDGAASGSSQAHPHAQVIGLPFIPGRWVEWIERCRHWRESQPTDLLGALLDRELVEGQRVVGRNAEWVAWTAWAPSQAFETWLVPRRFLSRLADADPAQIAALAELEVSVYAQIGNVLEDPPNNTVLMQAPEGTPPEAGVRLHVRIRPRVSGLAGFEIGTGVGLVSVFPEEAARVMRGEDP